MPTYILAQLKIHDRARYDRYVAGFMPVLIKYHGRLLCADEGPECLEGEWNRDKVVLIAFDDRDAAERWMRSPEYQAISEDRTAAADTVSLLLQGIPPASSSKAGR